MSTKNQGTNDKSVSGSSINFDSESSKNLGNMKDCIDIANLKPYQIIFLTIFY